MTRNDQPEGCSAHFPRQLFRFLDGDLPRRAEQRVQQHLQECAHCRRQLRQLQAVRRLLQQVPEATPPRSFTLSERDLPAPRRVLWYPVLRSATTVMAALVLAVFLLGLLQPTMFEPGPPAAPSVLVKPTPLTSPPPPSEAVAPMITRRAPPTSKITGQPSPQPTTGEAATISAETTYPSPVKASPWIRATVSQTIVAPHEPQALETSGPNYWGAIQVVGLSLLGLFIGLTWIAYRRERPFIP